MRAVPLDERLRHLRDVVHTLGRQHGVFEIEELCLGALGDVLVDQPSHFKAQLGVDAVEHIPGIFHKIDVEPTPLVVG